MDEQDVLAERFEAHRARLRAVAYQMLGSASEAEDAVQDAWLRLSRTDPGKIENLGGWLTTAVARVCLNMLQSRRDEPMGMHLPDSLVNDADGIDPEQQALLADSIGPALLVILHTLAPAERLAFILHDIFAVPVRRHRGRRRAFASRCPPTGQSRPPASPGRGSGPRHRAHPAAGRRRRLPHRCP
jgi:RNA polymerase sigma-70 factor (ECF subfamily)